MATAIFKHYDPSNSEAKLIEHDGERVKILGEVPLDHDEFSMVEIEFADGTTDQAFSDELIEREED